MKGSGSIWGWTWIQIYINSSFMFNQILCLNVVTLRMIWKFIISYCQNNHSTETQCLKRKAPKISTGISCDWVQNEWSICCLHGVHKLVCVCVCKKAWERKRELALTTQAKCQELWHKPGIMGAQRREWFTFSEEGVENFWRTRRWYASWSRITESVSSVPDR